LRALSACALVGSFVIPIGAIELTTETWEAQTAGKTVFVKFQAPW